MKIETGVRFVEGKHYTVLDETIPSAAEVIEFFYFGCTSCFRLMPLLSDWQQKTGNNIELIPAHTDTTLVEGAMLFHTFVEMGVLAEMYEWGYVIYMMEDSEKHGWERINEFLLDKRISNTEFWRVFQSDAVLKRLRYSFEMTKLAKVVSTPSFVVHGRYKIDGTAITDAEELEALLTWLADEKAPPEAVAER